MFGTFCKDETCRTLASLLEYCTFESNSNNNNNNNNNNDDNNRYIYVILIAWTLLELVNVELNIYILITFEWIIKVRLLLLVFISLTSIYAVFCYIFVFLNTRKTCIRDASGIHFASYIKVTVMVEKCAAKKVHQQFLHREDWFSSIMSWIIRKTAGHILRDEMTK